MVLIALHAVPALAPPLEYRYALRWAEPWRLLGAHWVHLSWPHALINAAAWFVVARLYAPELGVARQVLFVLIAALAIALGLAWLHPAIVWYRGFSGVLHALYFAGATQWLLVALRDPQQRHWRALWLPVVLLAGGAIKVALEQPVGSQTPYADWLGAGTVPQAHLLGAASGAVLGALALLRLRAGAARVR
jgi:rhomboid family GlyGly-CTERM serine protease